MHDPDGRTHAESWLFFFEAAATGLLDFDILACSRFSSARVRKRPFSFPLLLRSNSTVQSNFRIHFCARPAERSPNMRGTRAISAKTWKIEIF